MTPKFQAGDTVRCLNPSHPGENPFRITTADELCGRFYGHSPDESEVKHDSDYFGCRESELELVSAKEKS